MKALVLVIALALFTAACAGTESPTPSGPDTSRGPKRGGVLLTHNVQSAANTDPQMGQASHSIWPIISEYILRIDPVTWEVLPGVAEKWEYSADGKTLTLTLRKGVKFFNKAPANGREVEAKDVVYTLKGMTGQLYPDLPPVRFPRRSSVEQMVDAVAVDKSTVKITLSEPSSSFLMGLAEYRGAMVIPEGLREHFGDLQSLAAPHVDRYVAAGPFIMTKFTDLVEVEYERNPEYWEKDKPLLDKVRGIWIPDPATAIAAFISDQIHSISLTKPEDRDFILSQRPDTKVTAFPGGGNWIHIHFNLQKKPWDDVRVRRAIGMALDPGEVGETLIGRGKKQHGDLEGKPLWKYPSPIPWFYPEALPQEELAKMPLFETPKSQRTISEARRLLAEAGFANGFEFELLGVVFSALGGTSDNVIIAKSQIERVLPGMKVNVKIVEQPVWQRTVTEGKHDVSYYGYIHESSGVAMMKTPYHSKGGRNFARYNNPRVDKLLDDAARELDIAKRRALLHEAQRIALDDLAYVPTIHQYGQNGELPYVQGMRHGAIGGAPGTWYKEVWLDK